MANGCFNDDLSGIYDYSQSAAYFDGKPVVAPQFARDISQPSMVLGTSTGEERWIEVDLSEQKLKAWEGSTLYLETPVSTGLPKTPTPQGEFRIWTKLRYTKMSGGQGKNYYYLPNVPFTMFFENESVPRARGYGLHGTYWHNHFGTRRSHGCVNLPTPMAEKIYYWASPVLSEGNRSISSTNENPGTKIVIHE